VADRLVDDLIEAKAERIERVLEPRPAARRKLPALVRELLENW
jgi:hypothetical protein